jgi:hypothetical protein
MLRRPKHSRTEVVAPKEEQEQEQEQEQEEEEEEDRTRFRNVLFELPDDWIGER